MNNNTEVKGCNECPMFGQAYPSGMVCQHPEAIEIEIREDAKGEYITPEYCPLKFSSLTISIKQ